MTNGYTHLSLTEIETNDAKPSDRWELSPALGISAYNFNVARLEPTERLSQTAYHYHDNQTEFFYCISGNCRVETPDSSFDLTEDEAILFEPGTPHLLHNPYDTACKLIAIGHPPNGRRPVHMVKSYDEILTERYSDNPPNQ